MITKNYVVFVTTAKMKCFGCGIFGHLIRNCPDKIAAKEKNASENSESGDTAGVAGAAEVVLSGESSAVAAPGPSSESVTRPSGTAHTEAHSDAGVKDLANVAQGSGDIGNGQIDGVQTIVRHSCKKCVRWIIVLKIIYF